MKNKAKPDMRLDEIDVKILQQLQLDARISNVELADCVGLSPAPCLRRVRALETARVIRRYVTLLDPDTINLSATVFVQVKLDLQVEGRLEIFEQVIIQQPEVLECYLMTGDADYLLRVVVPNVSAYERLLRDIFTRIKGVAGIKSSFALKEVKYSTAFPLSFVGPFALSQRHGDGAPSLDPRAKSVRPRAVTGGTLGTVRRSRR